MDQKNIDNGIKAEKLFEQYLNSRNPKIPFYRIDQSKDTQAEELKEKSIRRPDYIIHTEKGIFYIDVKYRKKGHFGNNNEERFIIGQDNIISLYNFQKELHQEVWLALTNNSERPEFFYTNISCVYEYYANIKKIYEKKKYTKFSKLLMYIPQQLILFNSISFEKSFYNEPNLKYFEEEVEYFKRIASHR